MPRRQGRQPLSGLREAFDEARFGRSRTLNLRESLPTAAEAVARGEAWLRQQQVQLSGEATAEVLVITGRGNNSEGGVSVVRSAIEGLIHRLKQRGVVQRHEEHTPGSFVITLAPVKELWTVRSPEQKVAEPPPSDPPSLDALDRETRVLLRQLAERSLEQLGVRGDRDRFIDGEMVRQFSALSATLAATGSNEREQFLRAAIRRALAEYD
ncbi:MAG TPA: hypothetical protein VJW73_08995 [Gemmatimonadaceae bacterium]|nr:hypothetical protein [Gemmatimonadaceae bacterium]